MRSAQSDCNTTMSDFFSHAINDALFDFEKGLVSF